MELYNLITEHNRVTPNYSLEHKELSFDLYISHLQEVGIIGTIDNNYICWASLSDLEEQQKNGDIFAHVLQTGPVQISSLSQALGSRYQEVSKWHRFRIYKRTYNSGEEMYYSQAGQIFLGKTSEGLGSMMARELSTFYRQELLKSSFRLLDPGYRQILEEYRELLTRPKGEEYYHEMKPLIEILERESYLRLCPQDEIRMLYLDCMEACSQLYNRYMTAVR